MRYIKYLIGLVFSRIVCAGHVWTQKGGVVYMDQKPVRLRGLSWFGFETQDFVMNGLYSHSMDFYFSLMKQNGINALRVPFSAEWIYYNYDIYPYNGFITADPSLQGKKSIEILDMVFTKAARNGIVIMLDLHRLHKEYISELWYSPTDNRYTSDVFFKTWQKILTRYKDRPNLMALDLLNEPHGSATWGSGNPSTDWDVFVKDAIQRLSGMFPAYNWLYFVEGINWGHNLDAYRYHPILFDNPALQKRLVFSAHVYGNSVVVGTSTDPSILYPQWDSSFGFIKKQYNETMIIGEWGGQTSIDKRWMTILGRYLVQNKMFSNFFWSLMPNSGDVHGLLLDDYTTLDVFKMNLMKNITPNATVFVFP